MLKHHAGAYGAYSQPGYGYQQAAEAQAPPVAGAPGWASQHYANAGYTGYAYPAQAAGYDAYASQPKAALPQYPSSNQPPPMPGGGLVPPPPPS